MTLSSSPHANDDWSRLEAAIEAFALAWDQAPSPPDLAEHLARAEKSLQGELAVELIKLDLERRWQCGLRRFIEDYLEEVPELRERLPASLIFEEYHARKLAGDDVGPTELFDRFPSHVAELQGLFRVDPQLRSKMLADSASPLGIDLAPGETIDDFDLLLRLGQGAFATVFLARQRSMQRLVAVKVSADKGDEPQTLAQLDHDNIVRVYDQRCVVERELRLLYMQYAAGGTLADVVSTLRRIPREQWHGRQFLKAIDAVLDSHGESPPADSALRRKLTEMSWPQVVCWIGAQLARALDYAHRAGVLHRDLKPANVLLTAEGVPKLADFNVSFSSKVEGSSPAAHFGGSLAYMSPEQLEACNPRHDRSPVSLDGRSDLFSLGVLLWELLTGEHPFDDEADPLSWATRLEAMTERRQRGLNDFQRMGLRHADAPGLDEVLPRCLAAQPADRFATGLELAHELDLCLQPDARQLLSG
ncbi:MAG: serine/threonine protein kinase, partial [Candidatus Saccharimonas sp.]|nr:serine/threonine protein kinase [Planctomycetaceae bacterium]